MKMLPEFLENLFRSIRMSDHDLDVMSKRGEGFNQVVIRVHPGYH